MVPAGARSSYALGFGQGLDRGIDHLLDHVVVVVVVHWHGTDTRSVGAFMVVLSVHEEQQVVEDIVADTLSHRVVVLLTPTRHDHWHGHA